MNAWEDKLVVVVEPDIMYRICVSAWESKALEICAGYVYISAWESKALEIRTGYVLVHGRARHWKYVQDMY